MWDRGLVTMSPLHSMAPKVSRVCGSQDWNRANCLHLPGVAFLGPGRMRVSSRLKALNSQMLRVSFLIKMYLLCNHTSVNGGSKPPLSVNGLLIIT